MGGIFSKPKMPPPPEPPAPTPMEDEEAVKKAKQRAIARQRAGSGRASTLLSKVRDSDTRRGTLG